MARVKLSEFRAKQLLFAALQKNYEGVAIDLADKDYPKIISRLPKKNLYVTKVDQAVKKRGKSGLVNIKRDQKQVLADLRKFARLGFRYALVEPYIAHEQGEETYVALTRTGDGVKLNHSLKGGVEIEANSDSVEEIHLTADEYDAMQNTTGLDNGLAGTVYALFQKAHMTLLEINPLIRQGDDYLPLDAAVEVDSAGQFFVDGAWSEADVRDSNLQPNRAEVAVEELNAKSPASLSLKVLNPQGSLFLLLSGGGASVVVADELSQLGRHKDIANYGEYSGNPSEDETYIYTKEILGLMLKSKAHKKVLVIAGGVANFTDVAKTFAGIIRAMRETGSELKKQKIRVFVRRGGPNQQKGLDAMSSFLDSIGVKYSVYGPEKSLAKAVAQVAKGAA